jgi:hypothetical protein
MSTVILPEMNNTANSQRILSTLSRVEVDQLSLPSGEKTSQALVASQLLPAPANVFVPSADQVEDNRIRDIINANPLSIVLKPTHYSTTGSFTDKARCSAAKRTGKMLDFCNRLRLGDQTRSNIPGSVSIAPKKTKHKRKKTNPQLQSQTQPHQHSNSSETKKKKEKAKLSKSQIMGRQRLSMERGEAFLLKSIGRADMSNTSKLKDFPIEKIHQWYNDIPEEFRLCSLPSSPNLTVVGQLKPLSSKQKKKSVSMSALIQKDEAMYQSKYKKRKETKKNRPKANHKKKKSKGKGISNSKPSDYFRVNKSGLSRADKEFDALTKVVVGFDTFERGANPKRVPARLAQFWAQHEASGVGPSILSDGFILSEFDISIKKLGQLEVSKEMQERMKEKVLQGGKGGGGKVKTMNDIWNDFWVDEVGSELAAPLDSSVFVGGSGLNANSATREAPAFVVDDSSATARLPYGSRRFAFANHAHVAASRIQKVFHRRKSVRNYCSTKISSIFRGFKIRKSVKRKKLEMHASALLISTCFRGYKARKYVDMLRTVGWNHIAILCQRCMRRWLAKKEAQRRRLARIYNAATNIQRVWRGIWGRDKFKLWRRYVHDRSAKSIQNMVRWYNFRNAFEEYKYSLIVACEDIQRTFRGYIAKKLIKRLRSRIHATENIQRVWHGYLGRRRFKRKMNVIKAACTTIQIRLRGILARMRAAKVRTDILTVERERTVKEDAALARRLQETRDFMVTKAGKLEHKLKRKESRKERRGSAAKKVLMGFRKKRLLELKNGFELVDYKSTGLIDFDQFVELMIHVLHKRMSMKQLEKAWARTSTVVAKRGGYRLW